MDIASVATLMAVLFVLVVAGYAAHKCGLMGGEFDKRLSNIVILITCPCLVLSSAMGDTMPDSSRIPQLLLVGVITYAFLLSLAYVLPCIMPVRRADRGVYRFMLAFGNVGFIGYPVVASMFGHEAVFYASVLNVANTISVFVWGVMFLTDEKGHAFHWSTLRSPAMLATYASIAIVAAGWRAPAFVAQACTLLGGMTVPASLLVIGSSIAAIPARRMVGSPGVYMMCALRLLLLPLGLLWLLRTIGVDREIASIDAVLVAMPVASFGTMFCLKYGRDDTIMSQGTFLSTLLAVVSIPLLAMVM